EPGEFAPEEHPALHPGRAARVTLGGLRLGWLGELSPEVREAHDLPDPVYVAELDLDQLRQRAAAERRYQ
ncbi:MAG: hypothetical protein GTO28_03860, partial [Gammaproteobacteria bacterium]|nr:hypothetical protein [Gammaproteobacteria bacterium]NIR18907.1 hypothetical protein [Gammaproteobacteria bacterium]